MIKRLATPLFLKISFAEKRVQENHQSVKQLGKDQHLYFVGPYLSSNCYIMVIMSQAGKGYCNIENYQNLYQYTTTLV